ncbi:MAG: 2-oxoglutarate dehydrogenase, E2 component, dihydrolipoamide succinyltransferase [Actinomycetota bacterium]|nr:2-oxoglutarate dehydrogenase, E2 component, dihydrolipoamide succinyltransferase [Actinomycetota bacterium]
MSFSVTMPALGESVSEGTVTRWLKQEGERVEVDEPLLEVSTDKVDTEIPSPAAGVVQRIVVAEDETVSVGAELAVIGDGAAPAADGGQDDSPAQQSDQTQADQTQVAGQQGSPPQGVSQAAPPVQEQAGTQYPAATQGIPTPSAQPQSLPDSAVEQSGGADAGAAPASSSGGVADGTPVTMPALGESVSEGTVTRWLKQVGDTVAVDEPLLEVSTDKVDTEIPSPVAGTVLAIAVNEDETVPVGAELAVIGDAAAQGSGGAPAGGGAAGTSSGGATSGQQTAQAAAVPQQSGPQDGGPLPSQAPPAAAPAAPQQPAGSVPQQGGPSSAPAEGTVASESSDASAYVTPLVRKLAAEQGVDLSTLTGTGVGGRIRKQDVLDAAEKVRQAAAQPAPGPAGPATPAAAPAPPEGGGARPSASPSISPLRGTTEKMSRLRKVIAERMVQSLQTSAQLTTVVEVDVTRIARLRDRAKAEFESREGVRLSFLPFFAKAAVEALKAHPKVNASIEGDQIVYHAQENLGVAVDTERGLLVPVIRDAGDLNLAGLARKITDLADRTRRNKIGPDELSGGTFTLTNTGSRGALFDTPIINQPQVGILGTGSVVKRPVVVSNPDLGETIAVRSMIYLALSYDHRLVDGADAARFLMAVKARLEEGQFEGELGL